MVSAGAGKFEAQSFISPNFFSEKQVNYDKDYNLGIGTRSSNWHTRPNETSALLELSVFHESSTAPETSVFNKKSILPETSSLQKSSVSHKTSIAEETSIFLDLSVFHETDATPKLTVGSIFLTLQRPIPISAIGRHSFR